MSNTPRGAPELALSQALPETTVNQQIRHSEAGACHFVIADNDLTAPPGACVDGANYTIAAAPTGLWTGKVNQIATAVGINAASGWLYHVPVEGFTAYIQDENARHLFDGAAWVVDTSGGGGGTAATLDFDIDGTLAANSDARIATQKATKTYVDGKVAGLSWKQAVRAATTAAGTLATAFAAAQVIDGVTLATGDRILIKNQAAGAENGLYTVNASGAPTRTTDADSGAELVNATAYVSEGTANADTQWTCSTNAPIVVGTTALGFAQINTSGVSLASTSEVLTGTDSAKATTPDAIAALWEQGADVASAAIVALGEGGYFVLTGTTTITDIDFATDKAGRTAWVKFAGVLTLTHNATTLILPTAANIVTAAGDTACFVSEGADAVRCVAYQRASGSALVDATGSGGGAATGFDGSGNISALAIKGTTAGTPGTGAFTPNAASSGFRAWSALYTGWIGLVRFDDGSAWELCFAYWNGTTLSRGALFASSSGSAISLTSSATAALVNDLDGLFSSPVTGQWRGLLPIFGSGSSHTAIGIAGPGALGTNLGATLASTNYLTEQPRVQYTSATTANAQAGLNAMSTVAIVSATSPRGGWTYVAKFGASQIPTGPRYFVGVSPSLPSASAEPSSYTGGIAVFAKDSTDTNIQFLVNDNSASGTKTDTGLVLTANGWYGAYIWQDPGTTTVKALLVRYDTGDMFYTSTSTDVPPAGSLLSPCCNGGLSGTTGTALIFHIGTMTLRTGR